MTSRGLRLRGFSLRPAEAGEPRERTRKVYATLAAILAESPEPVAAVYPLDQVERALEACATPGRGGRVLLAASPTRNAPSPDGNALT